MSNTPAATTSTFKRLEGKVAIITGGASGIGACTAKLFVKHGAKVAIADIQDELGQSICNDLGSQSVSYVHCDVTNESDVEHLIQTTVSKYGHLDIMYSNAGIAGKLLETSILDSQAEDMRRVLDVNLVGGFLCAKHAAKAMAPGKRGVILFTASAASVAPGLCSYAYGVSKMAIVGLTRHLCVDLGKYGIRVNCISPAAIATPMWLNATPFDKDMSDRLYEASTILKGSVIREEDVAEAALYLASDESKVVSGQNLVLDGGFSTTNTAFNIKFEEIVSSS